MLFFEIRLLDSMQFISGSLDALSINYSNDFKITWSYFPEESWNLISHKRVLPYNYLDNFDKLNLTKLPNIEEFNDTLKLKKCKQEDYDRAIQIWNMFKCKSIKDYFAIYLKCDVLILADIIECFRHMCLKNYGLNPVYYYTSPNFFWDAALKMTNVKLELLTSEDSEIMLMFEKPKRGGISCTGSSKFVIYTDCNPELKQQLYDKCLENGLKPIEGFNEYYDVKFICMGNA